MPDRRKLTTNEKRHYISLRRGFNNPVIGITGFLGKTTTLEMIRNILETKGKVLKNSYGYGSWGNNIKTMEDLDKGYDYALFEFDYQRGNNFAEILRLIKPTIGIVTNIGDAHLNYLGGMMRVAIEKSEVVKYLARDGVAILNKDDELSSALADHISTKNIIKYGMSHHCDYYASDIEQLGPHGIKFKLNGKYNVTLPIYSPMDVYNMLAAIAAVVNLKFTLSEIIDILSEKFVLASGRGQLQIIDGYFVLDESYQANPRSLSKAARALISFQSYTDRLIFIVGDMMNAGGNVEDQHLNMGYFLSALPINHLIAVGEYGRYLAKGASLIKSKDKTVDSVQNIDEILSILDRVAGKRAAISVKGLGSVAIHRIMKFLKEKNT
ncbi:MAG: UDP-N-acetylmuramoyl-tripeptide--D-alanyl-D-alanine ligase [Calditrichaceae bacterium]|nr:UDP-N-acetylmuramoyl-tripeptide--D-alanyl-D-alanine ligase [Calditrichaceae bacterium]MBN2709937.1 UDP-N-acetylmuramoyl-tripeptide--D-alanyl-D-alanine ligase [Calditrichaceae bacterium]RQV92687.1 MAG: UDP-N-acetylmuramoyl-tripeptide--D-alanyl-D-alanine ligase [Calditrichota bacterium]